MKIKSKKTSLYGPEFHVCPIGLHPLPAQTFKNLSSACQAYEDFLIDCDRWGQSPAPLWLYYGKPSGNEDQYGYPDYPDIVLDTTDRDKNGSLIPQT